MPKVGKEISQEKKGVFFGRVSCEMVLVSACLVFLFLVGCIFSLKANHED